MSEFSVPLEARIYVAGHRGMVGSAILRALQARGHTRLITRSRDELDLREQAAVRSFFEAEKPEYVFLAAARVGGIFANNTYRADFIYENLAIQSNVMHEAWKSGVRRLLFLGSSCIYPKHAPQPMQEEHLLTGELEPTNRPYAIAKIAGIEMCDAYHRQHGVDFRAAMPTNLYGPGDNFDLNTSHVIPALIRKFHGAKERNDPTVGVWGSGKPRREFLHVADLADACLLVMNIGRQAWEKSTPFSFINIGCGTEITISELALLVQRVVGYAGQITFDVTKPDGTPRKLLDITRVFGLGWRPAYTLERGLEETYVIYQKLVQ